MQTAVESKLAWGGARDAELQTTQPCLGDRHHPRHWDTEPTLKPCLASSSPSSPFHTLRMLQGQGEHAFSRPVCHPGYTAVNTGKPNYRCDKWEKSNPFCPKRSGKEGGCTSVTAKGEHSAAEDGGVNHKLSRTAPVICICCIWYLRVLLRGCSSSVLMQKWWSADKVG